MLPVSNESKHLLFPTLFEEGSICLHIWLLDGMECYLLHKGGTLECEIRKNGTIIRNTIGLNTELKIETAIKYLIACKPSLVDQNIKFEPQEVVAKWKFGEKKVKLLCQSDNSIVWQIFDKQTTTYEGYKYNTIFYDEGKWGDLNCKFFPFVPKGYEYPHPCIFRGAYSFQHCRDDQCLDNIKVHIDFVQDCEIIDIYSKPGRITIFLKHAFSFKYFFNDSYFNKRISINQEKWALTVVNTGRSSANSEPDDGYGHGAFVVEGIDNLNERCTYFIDACECGIRIFCGEEAEKRATKFIDKSRTFLIPRVKIEKKIAQIQEEAKKEFYFSPRGTAISTLNTLPIKKIKNFDSYETVIKEILGCEPQSIFSMLMGACSTETTQPIPYRKVILMNKYKDYRTESNAWIGNFDENEIPMTYRVKENWDGTWSVVQFPMNCITWVHEQLADFDIYCQKTFNPLYISPKDCIRFGEYYINLSTPNKPPLPRHIQIVFRHLKDKGDHSSLKKPDQEDMISKLLEHRTPELIVWLASIHEIPGISCRAREFIKKWGHIADSNGQTAIHLACAKGYIREARIILSMVSKTHFNGVNDKGLSVLDIVLSEIKDPHLELHFLELLGRYNVGLTKSRYLFNGTAERLVESDDAKMYLHDLRCKCRPEPTPDCVIQ
jgi:hypothetical protein